MIDSHMHLEQKDYDKDRDKIILKWKKELKAIITVCTSPKDWEVTKKILKKTKGFVYAVAAIHPQYIVDFNEEEINTFIQVLRTEAKNEGLVGIGECGLDYHWVKEEVFREKQKVMFIKFINLSKELNLPLIVHSRNSDEDLIKILESEGMKGKRVMLHQFEGKGLAQKVIINNWFVSIGPGIQRSKNRKRLVRDLPLKNLLLETDSPWFGDGELGTPLNVKKAAAKIAEIKGITLKEVEKQTDLNAIKLFGLKE